MRVLWILRVGAGNLLTDKKLALTYRGEIVPRLPRVGKKQE